MKLKLSVKGILCHSCAIFFLLVNSIFAQSTSTQSSVNNATQVPILNFQNIIQIYNGSTEASVIRNQASTLPAEPSTLSLLTPRFSASTQLPSSTEPQTSPTTPNITSTTASTTPESSTNSSIVIEYYAVPEEFADESTTVESQTTNTYAYTETTYPAPEALRESPTPAEVTTTTTTTTTPSTTTPTTTTTPKPIILGPPIKISPGEVRPAVLKSRQGRKYYAFKGIPYGHPPVFFQRFKESGPVAPWSDVRNATEYGPSCIQYNILTEQVEGEEDCLTLNIFTPRLQPVRNKKRKALFPVMVFFHQGAFMFGTSRDFQEKYLMDEDVVLVTVNYRLGAFGFLNTEGDSDARGNQGLKDQVLALKFIRENIHHFNGEPNSVTIFGESAGGSSVHYHLLSERSKGLFNRAISMSGTALSPWAFTRSPRRAARKLGTLLNCPTTDMNELFTCLQGHEARVIAEKTKDLYEWNTDPITPFAPSIEVEESLSSFITQSPYSLMKSGLINTDTPWMLGVVENVCLLDAWSILVNQQLTEDMNVDWHRIAPVTFMYRETALEPDAISNQIKAYYFGTNNVGNETAVNLTNLYSDRYFNHGIRQAALMHVKHNEAIPVYLYIFSYRGSQSHTKFAGVSQNLGVSEGDELRFLFNTPRFDDIGLQGKDGEISRNFVKLFVSFAREGKPTAVWGDEEWKPISPNQVKGDEALRYYSLNDKCGFIDEPFSARMNFWDTLPLNEYENEVLSSLHHVNHGDDEIFTTFNNNQFN